MSGISIGVRAAVLPPIDEDGCDAEGRYWAEHVEDNAGLADDFFDLDALIRANPAVADLSSMEIVVGFAWVGGVTIETVVRVRAGTVHAPADIPYVVQP